MLRLLVLSLAIYLCWYYWRRRQEKKWRLHDRAQQPDRPIAPAERRKTEDADFREVEDR